MAPDRKGNERPFWMILDPNVEKATRKELSFTITGEQKLSRLRDKNKKLQLEQPIWNMLSEILDLQERIAKQEEIEKAGIVDTSNGKIATKIADLKRQKADKEKEVLDKCNERFEGGERYAYLHGPVGELPVHNCLLLRLVDLTKRLVDKMHTPDRLSANYNSKHDVNMPYVNDFDVWKRPGIDILSNLAPDDGGLYTGETLLHLAIVQRDMDLVRWLLSEKNSSVASQATGAFFKASEIAISKKESTARVAGRRIAIERSRRREKMKPNKETMCDYGEFPLSFAASMGQVEMMGVIKEEVEKRAENKDTFSAALDQYPPGLRGGASLSKLSEKERLRYLLLNVQDSCGNTALHMAVLHNQIASIDWLLDNDGRPSITLINNEGFTPLTLAAHKGFVQVFHHLREKMTDVSWQYGNVAYTMLNLEQIDTFVIGAASEDGSTGDEGAHAQEAEEDPKRPPLDTHHKKWRSALDIIVRDEKTEFAHDPFFVELIMEKWNKFAQGMFLRRKLIPHLGLTVAFFIVANFRSLEIRTRWEKAYAAGCPSAGVALESSGNVASTPPACLTSLYENSKPIRWWVDGMSAKISARPHEAALLLAELVVLAGFAIFMLWTGRMYTRGPRQQWQDLRRSGMKDLLFKNKIFVLDYVGSVLLVLALVFRCLGDEEEEMQMLADAAILLVIEFVLLLVPFRPLGAFIITMYRMVTDDVLKFLVVYCIIAFGFNFAMTVLVSYPDPLPPDWGWGWWSHFWNNFEGLVWTSLTQLQIQNPWDPWTETQVLVQLLTFFFGIISIFLLLNFLIAMMGRTFSEHTDDMYKTWIMPFAHEVLTYEEKLSPKDRADPKYRTGEPKTLVMQLPETTEASGHGTIQYNAEPFYQIKVGELEEIFANGPKIGEMRTESSEHDSLEDKETQEVKQFKETLLQKLSEQCQSVRSSIASELKRAQ